MSDRKRVAVCLALWLPYASALGAAWYAGMHFFSAKWATWLFTYLVVVVGGFLGAISTVSIVERLEGNGK